MSKETWNKKTLVTLVRFNPNRDQGVSHCNTTIMAYKLKKKKPNAIVNILKQQQAY